MLNYNAMQQLQIYIVEDEPIMAHALKRMVFNMGHQVCGVAESYEEAITDMRILPIDLVITDIMIKGPETGIDLAKYINHNIHVPFIFQSSITCADLIKKAFKTKPNGFLQKPVSKAALAQAMLLIPALQH